MCIYYKATFSGEKYGMHHLHLLRIPDAKYIS